MIFHLSFLDKYTLPPWTVKFHVRAAILGLCEFLKRGAGVNLGGWLVLEDWFFSGTSGSDFDFDKRGQEICKRQTKLKGSVLNMAESQFWKWSDGSDHWIKCERGSCVLNVSKKRTKWTCLENGFGWGFVMSQGAGQGQCLPPLLPHSDEPWPSEGVLAHRLNATKGKDFHWGLDRTNDR